DGNAGREGFDDGWADGGTPSQMPLLGLGHGKCSFATGNSVRPNPSTLLPSPNEYRTAGPSRGFGQARHVRSVRVHHVELCALGGVRITTSGTEDDFAAVQAERGMRVPPGGVGQDRDVRPVYVDHVES